MHATSFVERKAELKKRVKRMYRHVQWADITGAKDATEAQTDAVCARSTSVLSSSVLSRVSCGSGASTEADEFVSEHSVNLSHLLGAPEWQL